MQARTANERRKPPLLLIAGLLFLLAMVAAFALAWHPAIAPVATPAHDSFDSKRLARGRQLAAIGNCAGCHSAPDGKPYAGSVAIATPFGIIYSTNITPDADTGIGAWSEQAFRRALREGVSRDGHLLYPAFPYDHYTRLSEEDIGMLYAFLMTREPVREAAHGNRLRFPLGFRPLVAGWNLLYLDKGPYRPVAGQSAEWNRGAYLTEGLGHCSACHTPRNALGAERKRAYLGGGQAEGWYAPALNADSPSPQPWTVDELSAYLRTGISARHAIAAGPMQDVVHTLSHAEENDVRAIAAYIKSVQGEPAGQRQRAAASLQRASLGSLAAVRPSGQAPVAGEEQRLLYLGESVYAGACAGCHDAGRGIGSSAALRLPLAVAVYDPDPRSLIRIIREGIMPAPGETGRWMPGFAGALTDEQITALLVYLRRHAADLAPWPDVAAALKEASSP